MSLTKALSIFFYTLGCKLNQVETESIASSFFDAGFTVKFKTDDGLYNTDIVLLNTCTVTSKAEQKARLFIRKVLHNNLDTIVIVTGCYAQLAEQKILSLGDGSDQNKRRLFVVKGSEKQTLTALPLYIKDAQKKFTTTLLSDIIKNYFDNIQSNTTNTAYKTQAQITSTHSRPFLKIQDGCNNDCSFCAVHIARGKSTSVGSDIILESIRKLELSNTAEVVLTGVNIMQYNDGLYCTLSGLLNYILTNTNNIALRLGSLELDSQYMNDDFFSCIKHARIRPHFHLSIQSLNDIILQKMNRHYTSDAVVQCIQQLRKIKNDPFIAADIITGFPGESDSYFDDTLTKLTLLDLAWIHAFPFSPRPNTPAAAVNKGGHIPERIASERVSKLTALAGLGKRSYEARWKNKRLDAVVELCNDKDFINVVTENNIHKKIPKKNLGDLDFKRGTKISITF